MRSSAVATEDRSTQVTALERLLRSDPAAWPALAPEVVARVGQEELEAIVRATRARVGGIATVVDAADGLHVEGPQGGVLAWVSLSADGLVNGLLISRALVRSRRIRIPRVSWLPAAAVAVWPWFSAALCWNASRRGDWAGAICFAGLVGVVWLGLVPGRSFAVPLRAFVGVGAAVAALSAIRLDNGLKSGGDYTYALCGAALLVLGVGVVLRARRHRWGVPVTASLTFPLRGSWYVGQGGGRLLNHHADVPDQRGAVDLLRVGRWGTRRGRERELSGYLAYGQPVYSPCPGTVVTAADNVEDQVPGCLRFAPTYGNVVVIDTGAELVRLAHLRPGTVAVRVGDVVSAGQLLGEVGNSGSSSEPHLHLQADRGGLGLDLVFVDIPKPLHRGRSLRA